MQSATPDQPRAASPWFVRLLRLMLYIGIGLLAVFVGMVLLIGMEMVISRIAQHLGVPLTGRSQNLFYIAVRGLVYLPLAGLVAWVMYLFTTHPAALLDRARDRDRHSHQPSRAMGVRDQFSAPPNHSPHPDRRVAPFI